MSRNTVRAKISSSTGIITTQTPVTLADSQTLTIYGPNRFDTLTDVEASGEVDGAVPVYNAALDKYVVQTITANLISSTMLPYLSQATVGTVSPNSVVIANSTGGISLATLQSYLITSGLTSNASTLTITSNSTVSVSITANTLTLGSPLAITSGGTGLSAVGAVGQVLVSNGSAMVWTNVNNSIFI